MLPTDSHRGSRRRLAQPRQLVQCNCTTSSQASRFLQKPIFWVGPVGVRLIVVSMDSEEDSADRPSSGRRMVAGH